MNKIKNVALLDERKRKREGALVMKPSVTQQLLYVTTWNRGRNWLSSSFCSVLSPYRPAADDCVSFWSRNHFQLQRHKNRIEEPFWLPPIATDCHTRTALTQHFPALTSNPIIWYHQGYRKTGSRNRAVLVTSLHVYYNLKVNIAAGGLSVTRKIFVEKSESECGDRERYFSHSKIHYVIIAYIYIYACSTATGPWSFFNAKFEARARTYKLLWSRFHLFRSPLTGCKDKYRTL